MSPDQQRCFTVFTPTHNRAKTLHRVYDSLIRQTFRDFEWLIVDDGSTDETRAQVEQWTAEAQFPIRYEFQRNQGKQAAFNRGVRLACGEFFLPLDSDDSCVPEALQVFHDAWLDIPPDQRSEFSGVCALCMDEQGKLIGMPFPADVFDAPNTVIIHKYRIKGEKWGFQRTDVLREYPFPELPGQRFVPEDVVWSRIASRFKERFVNRMLRVYFNSDGTASDQLTAAPVWQSAEGRLLGHLSVLNERLRWARYDPVFFFKSAVNVSRISRHAGVTLREQWDRLSGVGARSLWLIGMPVGMALYWRDCRRRAMSQQ
jgi:glycosyltransferase involved in cell wall biosynthesis